MNDKICVYWWKHKAGNFGDEASPYLISKLSGKSVRFVLPTLRDYVSDAYHLIKNNKLISALASLLKYRYRRSIILGIGSILKRSNDSTIAWGSGFLSSDDEIVSGKIVAVRGEYTACRLKELDIEAPSIYGDPALLLPLVYQPKSICNDSTIGIIPHQIEYEKYNNLYSSSYKVIDLSTRDIEGVIDTINECKYILASSLHGIIVSQAYGIPALWFEDQVLLGDGFKFKDYFTSVGIKYYNGFSDVDSILADRETVVDLFRMNVDKSHINKDLSKIQCDLLGVAPFEVLSKYKSFNK